MSDRLAFLSRKRDTTKADLLCKFHDEDWHGVADAAMDLRDIDSEMKGLRAVSQPTAAAVREFFR